ncbi:hypothetical protein CDAR_388681 [Caerostris darwini]|uniref:Secreted protein n=1 Tax=Caerostris darwini TaxID=1538125 RepID=A0AAV4S5P6_9ARAC|nr:hypothetical protein CDAR_388681 [Caerostris darwini]
MNVFGYVAYVWLCVCPLATPHRTSSHTARRHASPVADAAAAATPFRHQPCRQRCAKLVTVANPAAAAAMLDTFCRQPRTLRSRSGA